MNQNLGKRNKQAVQVLNQVEYDENGNPIGMKEDRTNPASANFGTEREPLRGGCYQGPAKINYDYSTNKTGSFSIGAWVNLGEPTDQYPATVGINRVSGDRFWFGASIGSVWNGYYFRLTLASAYGKYYLDFGSESNKFKWSHIVAVYDDSTGFIKIYLNNKVVRNYYNPLILEATGHRINLANSQESIFGAFFTNRSISDTEVDKLYNFKSIDNLDSYYTCSENSGDVAYDSSGNGNHGQIINAITTTPEENPNSIHQYQDVYSFENEEGYTRKLIHNTELINNDYWKHKWGMYPEDLTIQDGVASIYVSRRGITDTSRQDIGMEQKVNSWIPEHEISFKFRADLVGGHVIKSFSIRLGNIYPILSNYSSGDWITVTRTIPAQHVSNYMLYYENHDPDSIGSVLYIKDLSININKTIFPKDSSITLPPFKDVLGNNLPYVGKVPGKAKFVGSSCFLSDGNAYLSGDVLTTDTITAHPDSEVPVCTIDGRLDFPIVGGKYFGVTIERGGSVIARLPLCEPIIDPSNHIYHDVSDNGNHATLVNGTLANNGYQDKFHYLQNGFIKRGTGEVIPILEDKTGFADGSNLNDNDAILQDGKSFLNTGTLLKPYAYPALQQADKVSRFWTDINDLILSKEFSDFTGINAVNRVFSDISNYETVKNIRVYPYELTGRQLNTEKKITNN